MDRAESLFRGTMPAGDCRCELVLSRCGNTDGEAGWRLAMASGKITTSKAETLYSSRVVCVTSTRQRWVAIGARTTAHTHIHVYDGARGRRDDRACGWYVSDCPHRIPSGPLNLQTLVFTLQNIHDLYALLSSVIFICNSCLNGSHFCKSSPATSYFRKYN